MTLLTRRGQTEILQVSFILFFVLLVIVAIALLFIDKKTGTLETVRPELQQDLYVQKANAVIIALLRSPTAQGNLADTIIMDEQQKRYDEAVGKAFDASLTADDIAYEATIDYPQGDKLLFKNADILAAQAKGVPTARSVQYLPGTKGNIVITIDIAEHSALSAMNLPVVKEYKLEYSGVKRTNNPYATIMQENQQAAEQGNPTNCPTKEVMDGEIKATCGSPMTSGTATYNACKDGKINNWKLQGCSYAP